MPVALVLFFMLQCFPPIQIISSKVLQTASYLSNKDFNALVLAVQQVGQRGLRPLGVTGGEAVLMVLKKASHFGDLLIISCML